MSKVLHRAPAAEEDPRSAALSTPGLQVRENLFLTKINTRESVVFFSPQVEESVRDLSAELEKLGLARRTVQEMDVG